MDTIVIASDTKSKDVWRNRTFTGKRSQQRKATMQLIHHEVVLLPICGCVYNIMTPDMLTRIQSVCLIQATRAFIVLLNLPPNSCIFEVTGHTPYWIQVLVMQPNELRVLMHQSLSKMEWSHHQTKHA